MAVRKISTKLAIDGESEYKASLSRINNELKTLQSSLKATESKYRENATSMEALRAKGDALAAVHKQQVAKVKELQAALDNAKNAEKQYAERKDELKKKIDENNKALEKLKATTGDTSKEETALAEENKKLQAELDKCNGNLEAAHRGVNGWTTQLNSASVALDNLDEQIRNNDAAMQQAADATDGAADAAEDHADATNEQKDAIQGLASVLAASGIKAGIDKIVDALKACIAASTEFETAMAGVKRTVGGSDTFLGELGQSFQNLSTQIPITATELANIATTAGQLGIAQDKVEQFSTVMAQLATTTDLTADTAATMLAQFANITGVTDFERLGSVVADLGDATATTASKVVEMSQGMAASASIAGMSATDIMAISAAVGSLGIEAQAGSTSMSQLISTLHKAVETGDGLEDFAQIANMSASEFKTAWGTNAAGALDKFIQGLNDTERNGKSAIVILDELGINNVRQTKAILGLASAGSLLSDTLKKSNSAWSDNTALANKAGIMYETTEAKTTMLKNSVTALEVAVGDKLTPALGNLAGAGKSVVDWATGLVQNCDWLVPAVAAVTAGLVAFSGAAAIAAISTTALGEAIKAAAAAAAANPIILAATAVAALGVAVLTSISAHKEARKEIDALTESAKALDDTVKNSETSYKDSYTSIEASAKMADNYISRLAELERQGIETNAQQAEYKILVEKLRTIMPELNIELDEQTGLIKGGAEALGTLADGWVEAARKEALYTKCKDQIAAMADAELELAENKAKLNIAQQEEKDIVQELTAIENSRTALKERLAAMNYDNIEATDAETERYMALYNQIYELDSAYNDLSLRLGKNGEEQENLNAAIAEGEAIVEENQAAVDASTEAYNSLTEAQESNADVQTAAAEKQAEVTESLQALAQAYKDAYDAAYTSIDGQIGLFDDFAAKVSEDTDTTAEMMDKWAKQTENLSTYTENLQKAAQYGIDEGLVKSLSDGSAESAGYLATIIQQIEDLGGTTDGMSEDAAQFVTDFNDAFAQTEQAKESFANTVAAMEVDLQNGLDQLAKTAGEVDFSGFSDAVDTAFSNVGVDFNKIGVNIGKGLASGIDDSTGEAVEAIGDTNDQVISSTESKYEEHSPSRVFARIGENLVAGMVKGISDKQNDAISAIDKVADSTTQAMETGAKEAIEAYDKEYSKLSEKTAARLDNLMTALSRKAPTVKNSMYTVGQQMVDGMIAGIGNRAGALYAQITSVVNASIARARAAADVHSPSRKTQEIFENVGEGMVVGLEKKRQKVSDTAQSVVDDALQIDTADTLQKAMRTISDSVTESAYVMAQAVRSASAAHTPVTPANTVTVGNVQITVNAPDGTDANEVAELVMDRISDLTTRREAVYA